MLAPHCPLQRLRCRLGAVAFPRLGSSFLFRGVDCCRGSNEVTVIKHFVWDRVFGVSDLNANPGAKIEKAVWSLCPHLHPLPLSPGVF